jgi:TonB family protein
MFKLALLISVFFYTNSFAQKIDSVKVGNLKYNQGVVKFEKKQYYEAHKLFELAYNYNNSDIDALYNMAICRYKLNDDLNACRIWKYIQSLGLNVADKMIINNCKYVDEVDFFTRYKLGQVLSDNDSKLDSFPKYLGGADALLSYISKTPYPKEARENDITGKVYVRFAVDVDGKVVDVEVVRTSSYDILDKTAVEHISNMKHWKPGIANGETVKVEFIIPISFNVSDSFIRW